MASQKWFLKNVAVLAGGSALGQIISYLVSPLLTRLYTPCDFGIFSIYFSITGIFVVGASFRFSLAIPLPKDEKNAFNLLALSLCVVPLFSGAMYFLIIFSNNFMSGWIDIPKILPFLWMIPAALFFSGLYQSLEYWNIRCGCYSLNAKARINLSLATAGAKVFFGSAKSGGAGLLWGDLLGRAWGFGIIAFLIFKGGLKGIKGISFSGMIACAKRYWKFPAFSLPGAFLISASNNLPAIFLAKYYGLPEAGWYALASRILLVPINSIGSAVAQVYLGEGARLIHNDKKKLKKLYFKTISRLFLSGLIPALIIIIWGPFLFTLIFGEKWEMAGRFARIMAPGFLAFFCIGRIPNFALLERLDIGGTWTFAYFIFIVSAMVVSRRAGFDSLNALMALSFVMVFSHLLMFFLHIFVIYKHTKESSP